MPARRSRTGAHEGLTHSTTLQAFPNLEAKRGKEEYTVRNVAMGTEVSASLALRKTLAHFRVPRTVRSAMSALGISRSDIEMLLSLYVLVRTQDMQILGEQGLAAPAASPVGAHLRIGELEKAAKGDFVFVGAPVDALARGAGGARFGPFEIRDCIRKNGVLGAAVSAEHPLLDFEFRRKYSRYERNTYDLGDLVTLPGEPFEQFGARLTHATKAILKQQLTPVILGGDHSISRYSIGALLNHYSEIGIIHFDAHHDLYGTRARLTHANVFQFLLGAKQLVHLHQIGLRTLEVTSERYKVKGDDRLSFVSSLELQTMSPERVFAPLKRREIPYFITFDIDCISPQIAPETGTPASGGLTQYQAMNLLDYAYRNFHIVGLELVEVAKSGSRANRAASLAAAFAIRFCLSQETHDVLTDYVYH